MNRMMIAAIGVLLTGVVAQSAHAQWNPERYDAGRNRIFMTIGLDPAVVTSIGYARVVPVAGHDFQITTDVGMAGTRFDTNDFRARIAFESSIVQWQSVRLSGSAAFRTTGTQNDIYRGLNFGADITGTLGVYRDGWFAAAQFGKDKAIISHIEHTDWYREHVYADAKDGWYLDAGGTFHYGLTGGVAVGKAELVGKAGFRRTEDWNSINPPIYGSIGVGFGF